MIFFHEEFDFPALDYCCRIPYFCLSPAVFHSHLSSKNHPSEISGHFASLLKMLQGLPISGSEWKSFRCALRIGFIYFSDFISSYSHFSNYTHTHSSFRDIALAVSFVQNFLPHHLLWLNALHPSNLCSNVIFYMISLLTTLYKIGTLCHSAFADRLILLFYFYSLIIY